MMVLLSPNMLTSLIETPRYLRVRRRSTIWLMHVQAEMNLLPYVAVLTVACFLEYQSIGIFFMKCRIPMMEQPVILPWYRFAS
jgi:hypothetical protein